MKTITSDKNQEIKDVLKLKKSRNRKLNSLFIIDGEREIKEAILNKVEIVSLFICQDLIKNDENFYKNVKNIDIVNVSKSIFKKICYKEKPDGFLAIAKTKELKIQNLTAKQALNSCIVLESVEKPGNIGAIIRTAYAANIKTIFLTNNKTDIYNPNIIRSSEGMFFKVNLIETSNDVLLKWLKEKGIKIYSTTTKEDANVYTKIKIKNPSAFVFGSEAFGLTDFWLKNSYKNITIPMKNGIDSLNISVSVAIILFENLKQNKL